MIRNKNTFSEAFSAAGRPNFRVFQALKKPKRLQRYKKSFISANLRDEKWVFRQFVPNFRQFAAGVMCIS